MISILFVRELRQLNPLCPKLFNDYCANRTYFKRSKFKTLGYKELIN